MKRKLVLKNKINSVGRMNRMLANLRQNHEVLLQIKGISPDGKLPKGLLMEKKPTIKFASKLFNLVKDLDAVNEKRPKKKD